MCKLQVFVDSKLVVSSEKHSRTSFRVVWVKITGALFLDMYKATIVTSGIFFQVAFWRQDSKATHASAMLTFPLESMMKIYINTTS